MSKLDKKLIEFLKSQLEKTPTITVDNENKRLIEKAMKDLKPDENFILQLLPNYSPLNELIKLLPRM